MASIDEILADEQKLAEVTKAVFDQVDADQSGQIDRRELKLAMAQVAREANIEAPSDQSVDQALKVLDADGSGTIDVNEFKVLIRQLLEALR
ncbi:unnamed protein product [Blepharisma stoltei]|uniref:EF-hand domain-containing protein n=1 Tax=Blepharisma stoltei TaxID=1481888 RepID=A0AAU9JAQ9_9CILI|nr:unnamed protein product [Blepharisma stoltei]